MEKAKTHDGVLHATTRCMGAFVDPGGRVNAGHLEVPHPHPPVRTGDAVVMGIGLERFAYGGRAWWPNATTFILRVAD